MSVIRSFSAIAALVLFAGCDLSTEPDIPDPIDPALDTYAAALGVNIASMTKTASGLYYKDKGLGNVSGVAAAANDSIAANFKLWLTNGTPVDSSTGPNGEPIRFRIGAADIIRGFSEGFIGMKPGGVRQLVIPTALAWGPRGNSVPGKVSIQPNANVVFEIEFLSKF